MNGAELRIWRERLGLPRPWIADHLNRDLDTINAIESSNDPIDPTIVSAIRSIEADALALLDKALEKIKDLPHPVLMTFTTDDDLHATHPNAPPYPASWHRALAGRLLELVPNLEILYTSSDNTEPDSITFHN